MDPNFAPRHDIPNWSETRFFGHYSPESGVGLFVHAGRQRGFVDLWWSHTGVLLPDGRVVVGRQWQRTTDPMGLRGGNLTLVSTGPRRSLHCAFDGGGQLCDVESLARGVRSDGPGQVPVRWELTAQALRPVWDMNAQSHTASWSAGHRSTHTQQHFACAGTITVGNEVYGLDGPGYNDHSSGQRTWEAFGGHSFYSAVFPELSVIEITGLGADGQRDMCVGAVITGEDITYVSDSQIDMMTTLVGQPATSRGLLTLADGRKLELQVEVLGFMPITINDANENLNGCDWEDKQGTVLYNECWARYTLEDGTVGYGHLERSARRQWIDRDSLQVNYPARSGGI